MSSHPSFHRRYRAASLLALLAVLAQLWMVQLSQRHLAMQVSSWLQWGEICTTQNASSPDSSSDPMGMGGMGCPVCAVAGTGMAPGPAVVTASLTPKTRTAAPLWHSTTRQPQRERGTRPPAQAPPSALA